MAVAGMRELESRSRISGFCFDCSRWAPEGPLPRLWFPDRKDRAKRVAIVFGNRAGTAETEAETELKLR